MGLLSELAQAVENYPHEYLTLEIIDVDPTVGDTINEDEDIHFRIQVSNSGALDVQDLELLVEGLNGTEVKQNGALAQWGSSFTSPKGYFPEVKAHSANGTGPVVYPGSPLTFRRSRPTSSVRDLVRVSVAGWDTDTKHIFISHSRADTEANAVFSSTVSPQ